MKKRCLAGLIMGCTILMLGCSAQEADHVEDPDTPTITNDMGADSITQGEADIAGQTTASGGESAETASTTSQNQDSSASPESTGQTEEIGIDAAKKIALTRAGLTEQDGSWKEEKKDRDHGQTVYELEFISGNTEYEFEIDAKNGEILEYQKDPAN